MILFMFEYEIFHQLIYGDRGMKYISASQDLSSDVSELSTRGAHRCAIDSGG